MDAKLRPRRTTPNELTRTIVVLQYLHELEEQIQAKKNREKAERELDKQADLDMLQNDGDYFARYRSGGGGAPMRDRDGSVVTDLRDLGKELVTFSPVKGDGVQIGQAAPTRRELGPLHDPRAHLREAHSPASPSPAHDPHFAHHRVSDDLFGAGAAPEYPGQTNFPGPMYDAGPAAGPHARHPAPDHFSGHPSAGPGPMSRDPDAIEAENEMLKNNVAALQAQLVEANRKILAYRKRFGDL